MQARFIRRTVLAAAALIPIVCLGSSHREAPNITRYPAVDSTDLYLFMSYEPGREGYVTVLADFYPFQDSFGGPNYFALDENAAYTIHVDSNGDASDDIRFDFLFKNQLGGTAGKGAKLPIGAQNVAVPLKNIGPVSAADTSALNFTETYKVSVARRQSNGLLQRSNATNAADSSSTFRKPYDFVGTKTFGSVEAYENYARSHIHTINIPGCAQPGRVFVGQRAEPFPVNVGKVFDLVNLVPIEAGAFPGGIEQSRENNAIVDKNISTIALEVHASCLTASRRGVTNGTIGAWITSSLPQARILSSKQTSVKPEVNGGALTQISRLGMPLVNEIVIGLPDKDRFNSSDPTKDTQFLTYVTNPTLPALLDVLFRAPVNQALGANLANLAPSNLPRNDLVTAFLTGFPGVNQLAKVTPSEMQRLNTGIPAVAPAQQNPLGVLAGDLAGFPNGRRPGDDVVDIELRVAMGALCYPLPINGTPTDLGLCKPADAPVGNVPFTDGAPNSAADYDTQFPYLRTPTPGSADLPALSRN